MKHDAIVEQGIPIHERVPIPEEMIPEDSRVEIDAKIHAGYCEFFPNRPISTSRYQRNQQQTYALFQTMSIHLSVFRVQC
jgi:hypothetical protein